MTTIEQLPYEIDSNVTIKPPAKIVVDYLPNQGWYIEINGIRVTDRSFTGSHSTRYWDDAAEPMQWLIKRHLIITKAYKELDKAVKKVAKSKSD